jgi:adenosine deaminase
MSERNKTIDAARRLIKIRMQQAICRAKLKEKGSNKRIWKPMLELANGFYDESVKDWEAVKATPMHMHVRLALVVEAMTQATAEAGFPYRGHCDEAWIKQVISDFLATFDPMEMVGGVGKA